MSFNDKILFPEKKPFHDRRRYAQMGMMALHDVAFLERPINGPRRPDILDKRLQKQLAPLDGARNDPIIRRMFGTEVDDITPVAKSA